MVKTPKVWQGLLIFEVSWIHSGLLRTSDQPDAENCTWKQTTIKRDRHPCLRRNSLIGERNELWSNWRHNYAIRGIQEHNRGNLRRNWATNWGEKESIVKVKRNYRTENNSHVVSTANFKRDSTGATATRLTGHTTDVSWAVSIVHV
jgi:hypothetical protein